MVGQCELWKAKFARQTSKKLHFLFKNCSTKEKFWHHTPFFSYSETKESSYSPCHSPGTKYILLKQCVYVHIPEVNRSVKLIYFLLLFLLKCYRENLGIVNINSKWLPMIKCQKNSKALVFNIYLIILSVLQQILQLHSSTDQLKNTNYNKWDHA